MGAGLTEDNLRSGNFKAVPIALQSAEQGAGGYTACYASSASGASRICVCTVSSTDVGESRPGGLDLEAAVEDRPRHGGSRGVPPEEGPRADGSPCEEKQAKQTGPVFSWTLVVFRQHFTKLHIRGKSCSNNTFPNSMSVKK